VQAHFARRLGHSSCLNYLHRLGFARKRHRKRLLKADAERRRAFVRQYAALRDEAQRDGARIIFVDEAHFRADAELRAQWVLRGQPALVDSSSPRLSEKISYYSGVCLEDGQVATMAVRETCTAERSVAFLRQLRSRYTEPLIVIWDNSPVHHGPAMRAYLAISDLRIRLVALPPYSPDYNPDEAIWDWARAEATANTCFGTVARVQEALERFFAGLAARAEEVKRRCRRALQAEADVLTMPVDPRPAQITHVAFTVESV
jgi:transposase